MSKKDKERDLLLVTDQGALVERYLATAERAKLICDELDNLKREFRAMATTLAATKPCTSVEFIARSGGVAVGLPDASKISSRVAIDEKVVKKCLGYGIDITAMGVLEEDASYTITGDGVRVIDAVIAQYSAQGIVLEGVVRKRVVRLSEVGVRTLVEKRAAEHQATAEVAKVLLDEGLKAPTVTVKKM